MARIGKSLQERREEAEANETMKNCLLAMVRRHGRVLVTERELLELPAGCGLSVEVRNDGIQLEFMQQQPTGGLPDAG